MSGKKTLTPTEYNDRFKKNKFIPTIWCNSGCRKTIQENALHHALDIRKFEIEMYWKRATYFWTFIGAIFAGYLLVQSSGSFSAVSSTSSVNSVSLFSLGNPANNKEFLSIVLSSLGLVFSFAWYLVNKGSKFWQDNWERHVDYLEDEINGPLYKVYFAKDGAERRWSLLNPTSSTMMSVSKINQIISLYITGLWFYLLMSSLLGIKSNSIWDHTKDLFGIVYPQSCSFYALVFVLTVFSVCMWGLFKVGCCISESYKNRSYKVKFSDVFAMIALAGLHIAFYYIVRNVGSSALIIIALCNTSCLAFICLCKSDLGAKKEIPQDDKYIIRCRDVSGVSNSKSK